MCLFFSCFVATNKYLGKINYTYLTPLLPLASCLLPIFTRKLILHDYLLKLLASVADCTDGVVL
ncbi:MAG: hypothetical protein DWQ51_21570 [Microcystis wesenbergii TW10]|uniref:Uncharacterized protein n=1 Tax=Microcystis wesenbergii TW10 TaxID=2060474 RepID=A0A3E0LGQ4_9CHRO|nr:MAG: hypothetical protein DWQ51_21570 [Microcystis wesenbergii TW10]